MSRSHWAYVLGPIVIAFLGCAFQPEPPIWTVAGGSGDSGTGGGGGDTDIDVDTDGDTGTATSDTPGERMAGTWAMLINVATLQVGVPIVVSQAAASRNFFLVKLESDGAGNYTATEKLCGTKIWLETSPVNRSICPDSFVENNSLLTRHVTAVPDSDGSPWVSEEVWDLRGIKLADPGGDPLPPNKTYKKDHVVDCATAELGDPCDQDKDGKVGITNLLKGALNCEVYAVQRWSSKFEGAIVDKDTIEGAITKSAYDSTVQDASDVTCTLGNPGTAYVCDRCPDNFYFKMVRIKSGATCEDVLKMTTCYANEAACAGDTSQPLNPKKDSLGACKK